MIHKSTALQIAIDGAHYLARQVQADGKFVYLRTAKGPQKGAYNMLRHCGCIWAMASVQRHLKATCPSREGGQDLPKAIARARRYLLGQIRVAPRSRGLFLHDEQTGKLGGNALAILALPGTAHAPLTARLYEGLGKFVDLDTGRIRVSKFSGRTGHPMPFESEYYPGELVLALATLGHDHQAWKVVQTLRTPRDAQAALQDHWLLQGLEILHRRHEGVAPACVAYGDRIVTAMLADAETWMARVTPMACRTEGLISYYNMLKEAGDERRSRVLDLVHQLLTRQSTYICREPGALHGAFVEAGATRMDYTQHNLSGFLRFSQL